MRKEILNKLREKFEVKLYTDGFGYALDLKEKSDVGNKKITIGLVNHDEFKELEDELDALNSYSYESIIELYEDELKGDE